MSVRSTVVLLLTASWSLLSVELYTWAQPPDASSSGLPKVPSIEPKHFDELWFGIMRTENQWLRMAFYLRHEASGWTGHVVSLDQRAARIAVASVQRSAENLEVATEGVIAKYRGTIKPNEPNVCEGTWVQSGATIPLVLSRVEKLPPLEAKQTWRGEVNAILAKLKVQLRVIDDGTKTVSVVLFDSLSEGISSFIGTMQRSGESVTITVPSLKAKWRGTISADGREMKGTWSQGLIPITLNLRREDSPIEPDVAPPARPQTPHPPYPYEERDVAWKNDQANDVQISGTLLIPLMDHPFPAVVLVSGSGPQDRDETIAGHKPFWILADQLARHGIAVLRYDDRGFGRSTGDFAKAVTEDFVSDARSAVDWLAKQPGIDAKRIGIIGHSEGAAIATEIAATDENIALVVLLGGAGLNGKQIVVGQSLEMARRGRESAANLKALEAFITAQCDLVIFDDGTRDLTDTRRKIIADYIEAVRVPEAQRGEITDALERQFAQVSPWYRGFLKRDPAVPLRTLKQPVLAIWGAEDVQVPAAANKQAMANALEANPHKSRRELVIVPSLNHLLQPCKTGLPSEYGTIETTIDSQVLARIAVFCESMKDAN